MVQTTVANDQRRVRGLVPLLALSGVVVLVASGQARGSWLPNLHNGLLAVAFTAVGTYVSFQRPDTVRVGSYSALTWLSRTGVGSKDLPSEFANAVAHALDAPTATLWLGDDTVHAVGVWPELDIRTEPATITALTDSPNCHAAAVTKDGRTIGALSVDRERANHLSARERRLFNDLVSQASFVLEHIGLADLVAPERHEGHLNGLTPREHDVLALMARGLSNGAICEALHLSIKTMEPVVSSIFTKLGLHHDSANNRRVLAVVAFLGPNGTRTDQPARDE